MTRYTAQLNIGEVSENGAFDKCVTNETIVVGFEESILDALYEMQLRIATAINQLKKEKQ